MRTICIMNHKGGVGKTTSAVNLAAGLSRKDKKVLLIDLDPQSNISVSLKIKSEKTLYDALIGNVPINDCVLNLAKNFDVIVSKENLTKAEFYLSQQQNSTLILKNLLSKISGYDFMLIDCPPSLGILNQNVLSFCKEIFIPTSTDYLGFDALVKMELVVDEINKNYHHDIKITKIIPTLYDKRNKICKTTLEEIKDSFNGVVSIPIRTNSKLREAPKYGKSIFSHARSSPGAKDYEALVDEVIEMGSLRITEEVIA
ncbi:MAG: ParA family protein [Candidatus Woesearchaeota archaeon]